jgi:hypothetical protein
VDGDGFGGPERPCDTDAACVEDDGDGDDGDPGSNRAAVGLPASCDHQPRRRP